MISGYPLSGPEHRLYPRWLVGSSADTNTPSGFLGLLRKVIEGTAADVAWLAWPRRVCAAVFSARAPRSAFRITFEDLPLPPTQSLLISPQAEVNPWTEWCLGHGFLSGAIATFGSGKAVGTIGLLGTPAGAFSLEELRRLEIAAWLPGLAGKWREQIAASASVVLGHSRVLEDPLGVGRVHTLGSAYRRLKQALESALDATCWTLAVRDGDRLKVQAFGGRRPLTHVPGQAWPLAAMTHCAAALRDRRVVVMEGTPAKMGDAPEYRQLFSAGTATGVILPFSAGSGVAGVLIVGEERDLRGRLSRPEALARLELMTRSIGDLLQLARLVAEARAEERRRQARRAEVAERRRLSRELHDGVGQALTALLARARWAKQKGVELDDLRILEEAAQNALDVTRALVRDMRTAQVGVDALEDARRYAEKTLRDIGCELDWLDRTARQLASGVSREVAQVIKESITNVVRHARAQHVWVHLTSRNGQLRVTVRDDGVGLGSGDRQAESRGTGLVGNAERIARVGGTFEVRTVPRGGTLVVAEVELA